MAVEPRDRDDTVRRQSTSTIGKRWAGRNSLSFDPLIGSGRIQLRQPVERLIERQISQGRVDLNIFGFAQWAQELGRLRRECDERGVGVVVRVRSCGCDRCLDGYGVALLNRHGVHERILELREGCGRGDVAYAEGGGAAGHRGRWGAEGDVSVVLVVAELEIEDGCFRSSKAH